MSMNGAGAELQEMINMVKTELVNAMRDMLKILEEMTQGDVENFNHKAAMIEDIKKRYPWLNK